MISLSKVKQDKQEYKRIRTLFLSAFPLEERPPFFFLKARAKQNVDWWNILSDGKWVGFFYVINSSDLVYVFYFAIDSSMRGKGCGTAAMSQLLRLYEGKRLFLAIEPIEPKAENYRERVNRRNFYLKCGLSPLEKSIREGTVVYELLGVGGSVEPKEYKAMMDQWLGWPVKHLIAIRMLP